MTRLLRTLAALALVGVLGAASAGPAAAHGGPGEMTVERSDVVDGTVDLAVRLIYVDDGHGVPDATVTAVAVGPDGTTATPVPLASTDGDGGYAGAVTLSGSGEHVVRITSVEPPVSLEVPLSSDEEAPADPTTTIAIPSRDEGGTDGAPATTSPEEPTMEVAEDDDGGGSGAVVPVIAVGGVAAVAAGGALAWRRRSTT